MTISPFCISLAGVRQSKIKRNTIVVALMCGIFTHNKHDCMCAKYHFIENRQVTNKSCSLHIVYKPFSEHRQSEQIAKTDVVVCAILFGHKYVYKAVYFFLLQMRQQSPKASNSLRIYYAAFSHKTSLPLLKYVQCLFN